MQYVCLVYQEEQKLAELSDAQLDKITGDCIAYLNELEKSGHHVMSSGLLGPRSATTIRRENTGVSMTDGPFAETKECLGGFTIIEARDLSEALELAQRFPTGNLGCVEVRPVLDPTLEQPDPQDRRLAASVGRAIAGASSCDVAT